MTNKELQELLKQFPDDIKVVRWDAEPDWEAQHFDVKYVEEAVYLNGDGKVLEIG